MANKRERLPADERRQQIIDAFSEVAREKGFGNVRRDEVAEKAGVSTGLIHKQFNTMQQLRRAVMRHAVHSGDAKYLHIVAQGMSIQDPEVMKAPQEVRDAAIRSLMG